MQVAQVAAVAGTLVHVNDFRLTGVDADFLEDGHEALAERFHTLCGVWSSPVTLDTFAEPFGLTLNGLKKHVRILETVDLVVTEKVGRARECRLGPAQLEDATGWIDGYRHVWEHRIDRFGAFVEERR